MEDMIKILNLDPGVEWNQSLNEGKDVAGMKEELYSVNQKYFDDKRANADAAAEIIERIKTAPTREDFRFTEPNEYSEIIAARPAKRHIFSRDLTEDELYDKLLGAWRGRIAGCLLGKPLEGCKRAQIRRMCEDSGNYPISDYLRYSGFPEKTVRELEIWKNAAWADNFDGSSPIDDDIMYTVFSLYLLENRGSDFTTDDIVDGWTKTIPGIYCCTAERVVYMNHIAGLRGIECAEYNNPYREYLGAQIRVDLYGYINPGNPERAAEMAYRDARATHVKNGIYGAMFVAAMISAAAVCDDVMTVIEAGLDEIPSDCRLGYYVDKTISEYNSGMSCDEMIDSVHKQFDEYNQFDWCYAVPNCMIIVASLLHGSGDYMKTLSNAVLAGFDTDCNAATAGSIIGMMKGKSAVGDKWTDAYGGIISSPVVDYNSLTTEDAAKRTMKIINAYCM